MENKIKDTDELLNGRNISIPEVQSIYQTKTSKGLSKLADVFNKQ